MNTDDKILLDANVIANFAVCDLFLRLSEKPRLIIPKWSDKILNEVYSTHTLHLGWNRPLADSFQRVVRQEFPDAIITGY